MSLDGIIEEMISCDRDFYSMPRILRRVWCNLWQCREPLITLVGNFSYRSNIRLSAEAYSEFKRYWGNRQVAMRGELPAEVAGVVAKEQAD